MKTAANVHGVSRSGAKTMVSAQAVGVAAQLGGVAVLARILGPEIFGAFAVAALVIGLGELVREFGLSDASIQAPRLSHQLRSNLFWANTAVGGVLCVALLGLAPWIAGLFNLAELAPALRTLSAIFIIKGMSAQYRASMLRAFQFRGVARSEILGTVAGLSGALAVAALGGGIWALVVQTGLHESVRLLVLVAHGRWLPAPPARNQGTGALIRFGVNQLGSSIVEYGARNVDTAIVGTSFGSSMLGLYNRAFQMVMSPIDRLGGVVAAIALPVLSRAERDVVRLSTLLEAAQRRVLMSMVGLVSVVIVCAPTIVAIFLGPGWRGAAPIMAILGIVAAFQVPMHLISAGFRAMGRADALLRFNILARPAQAGMIWIGSFWGLQALAWAFAFSSVVIWIVGLCWIKRTLGVKVGPMFVDAALVYALFAVSVPTSIALGNTIGGSHWQQSIVGGAVLILMVSGVSMFISRLRRTFRASISFIVGTVPRKAESV